MADEAVLIEAAEPVASYLDSNAIIAAARYRADLV
jgi:acetyl/propionyl-CoA carboxylase alpha subunit